MVTAVDTIASHGAIAESVELVALLGRVFARQVELHGRC